MTLTQVVILGLVQGLTEFLPISSSGHLIVARLFFTIPDAGGTAIDAFLHLGTLVAVIAYYWRTWADMIRALVRRDSATSEHRQLAGNLLIATIPAAIAGYLWEDDIDRLFRSTTAVAIGFGITAAVLLLGEWLGKRDSTRSQLTWRESLLIGIAQIAALIPSVSRSGVTIAAGQGHGLSRTQATHFSFLMSAPIIAGAGIHMIPTVMNSADFSPTVLVVGLLVSCLSGLAAIYGLVRLLQRISLIPFAIYLFLLAGVMLVWL